jgi:hypothetical protein
MNFGAPQIIATVATLCAVIVAFWADGRIRSRHFESDSGAYWGQVLKWLAVLSLFFMLAFWLRQLLSEYIPLFIADRPYHNWLAVPFLLWLVMLWLGESGAKDDGRWLAGWIGFRENRRWAAFFLTPLIFPIVFGFFRIGSPQSAYPSATWATLSVAAVSIVFLAFSGRRATAKHMPAAEESIAMQAAALKPWPQEMKDRGVQVEPLAEWKRSPSRGLATVARDWDQWLKFRGSIDAAPEILDAGWRLLEPAAESTNLVQLMIAPDNSGQEEVTALIAAELSQRHGDVTLIITPSVAADFAERLSYWIGKVPAEHSIEITQPSAGQRGIADQLASADIWIVDAETLSDRILEELSRHHALLDRIGLLVWWDVHNYTGVLAANVWAISRRLQRMLKAWGRSETRVLAFARPARHGNAQLRQFIRFMLGYDFDQPGHYAEIPSPFARDLFFHRLVTDRTFRQNESSGIAPRFLLLPLSAARVSVEGKWPTWLERPYHISVDEEAGMLETAIGSRRLRESLAKGPTTAGAEIRTLHAADVLNIREKYCSGGRSISPPDLPHHIGLLIADENPYVSYLTTRLDDEGCAALESSRFLVGAAGHLSIVQRHMVSALQEAGDTGKRLMKAFNDESVVKQTLDQLEADNEVDRRPVRYLDEKNSLKLDFMYTSRLAGEPPRRPLSTVGSKLVEVHEIAGGLETSTVRLEVDPERITIVAYPQRIFFYQGLRYRVANWNDPAEVAGSRRLLCSAENMWGITWRRRMPIIEDIRRDGVEIRLGSESAPIVFTAEVAYQEVVDGVWERRADGTLDVNDIEKVRSAAFQTRALVFRFDAGSDGEGSALCTIAAALRHILPVHVGVEDDALEVIAPPEPRSDGRTIINKIVVVDSFPGGIGLADALYNDRHLVGNLLAWSLEWLEHCNSDQAALDAFKESPLTKGVLAPVPISVPAAIEFLKQPLAGESARGRGSR